MKLVILGANGGTGQQVVQAALSHGMAVRAVARHPDKAVWPAHEHLSPLVGDPCDPAFLARCFDGQDAVISTLGGRRPTRAGTSVYIRSARAIVEAAQDTGLQRVLVTSTALLFDPQPMMGKLLRVLVPRVVESAARMEEILRAAPLEWTVARPGFLSDKPQAGYHARRGTQADHGMAVSRAALAAFLVDALADTDTIGGAYSIADGAG